MVSRRRFLRAGSLAAGASAVLPTLAHAAEDDKSLPPAIAALKTRHEEAKPITVEERTARQENARRLMRENNVDAVLIASGTSLKYFTGIRWEGGERLFAMLLPAKGDAFFVAPAFEEGMKQQLAEIDAIANNSAACSSKYLESKLASQRSKAGGISTIQA